MGLERRPLAMERSIAPSVQPVGHMLGTPYLAVSILLHAHMDDGAQEHAMNSTSKLKSLDRKPYRLSITKPISEVAQQLLDVLGPKLTAYVVGLSDAKAIAAYAKGEREPLAETDAKMRVAHQVVGTLMEEIPTKAIPSWFVGMNPDLDDEAPAKLILDDPKRVLEAARAFAQEV